MKLLAAVNLDSVNCNVVAMARKFATALGGELEFIHVLSPLPVTAVAEAPGAVPPLQQMRLIEHDRLEAARQDANSFVRREGVSEYPIAVVTGALDAEILAHAKRRNCDIIIIGRGEVGSKILPVAKLATDVMRQAQCTVMCVNTDETYSMNESLETTESLIQLCLDLTALSAETKQHLDTQSAIEVVDGVGRAWQQAADVLTTQVAHHGELTEVPEGISVAGGFSLLITKIRATLSSDEQNAVLDQFESANVEALEKFERILDKPLLPKTRGIVMIHYNQIDHLTNSLENLTN